MLNDLELRLIFRRIDVEQRRGTPLLILLGIVREMIATQRRASL